MSDNDNKIYEPGIHLSLDEVERQAAKHKGNPIIQQLYYLMCLYSERFTKQHFHVSGATIGQSADRCAICAQDLRDDVHIRGIA